MNDKKDIEGLQDIELFVNDFYNKVQQDPLLSPVFLQRIPNEEAWPHHLQIMYSFWETVLFAKAGYRGNPFPKHIGLGIQATHFDTWVKLFHETIDKSFKGPKADETKERAEKMRTLFEIKLNQAGESPLHHLV